MNKLFLNHLFLQGFSAYNDTVLRIGLMTILIYGLNFESLASLSNALLLLPMLLFGYLAGCISTKYSINRILQTVKFLELLSIFTFHMGYLLINTNINISLILMSLGLFIAGLHAAINSTIKLSIIVYIFDNPTQISSAAAILQLLTFIAILTGSIIGTLIYHFDYIIFITLYICSIFGFISSFFYPAYGEKIQSTKMKLIDFNMIKNIPTNTKQFIYYTTWFWFITTTIQLSLFNILKHVYNAHQDYTTLLSILTSVGLFGGAIILILFLTNQYNIKQTITMLVLNLIASSIMIYILYINQYSINIIPLSDLFNHINLVIFFILSFILPMFLSIYSIPFLGDLLNSIEDKKLLNKILGIYTVITTLPIILAAIMVSFVTAIFYSPYIIIFVIINILILIQIHIHLK